MFGRLKDFRRMAIRFGRLAPNSSLPSALRQPSAILGQPRGKLARHPRNRGLESFQITGFI
jgi:hypothetical protein